MKFTLRDKICKLIGKYEEKEQQLRADTLSNALACAVGVKRQTNEEETAAKALMCGWFAADLKKLLEEDEPNHLNFCPCGNEDDYKKGERTHE